MSPNFCFPGGSAANELHPIMKIANASDAPPFNAEIKEFRVYATDSREYS